MSSVRLRLIRRGGARNGAIDRWFLEWLHIDHSLRIVFHATTPVGTQVVNFLQRVPNKTPSAGKATSQNGLLRISVPLSMLSRYGRDERIQLNHGPLYIAPGDQGLPPQFEPCLVLIYKHSRSFFIFN